MFGHVRSILRVQPTLEQHSFIRRLNFALPFLLQEHKSLAEQADAAARAADGAATALGLSAQNQAWCSGQISEWFVG